MTISSRVRSSPEQTRSLLTWLKRSRLIAYDRSLAKVVAVHQLLDDEIRGIGAPDARSGVHPDPTNPKPSSMGVVVQHRSPDDGPVEPTVLHQEYCFF